MEIIFKFSASANWRSFGNLAIEPSSSTISHNTATGSNPAKIERSTEASVCPALFKTPPSLYLRGKIWPGRLKSSGLECLDARANIVAALSRAETPVVVPYFASYDFQNNWSQTYKSTLIIESKQFKDGKSFNSELVWSKIPPTTIWRLKRPFTRTFRHITFLMSHVTSLNYMQGWPYELPHGWRRFLQIDLEKKLFLLKIYPRWY